VSLVQDLTSDEPIGSDVMLGLKMPEGG